MNKDELLKLAERAEQASGPDRELDALIHEAVTTFPPRRAGVGWPDENALVVPAFPGWELLPAYTASADAALSLLPKTAVNIDLFNFSAGRNPAWGCSFMDTAQLMGKRAAKEQIARLRKGTAFGRSLRGPPRVALEKAIAEHFVEFFCRGAALPALALSAASLRALALKAETPNG